MNPQTPLRVLAIDPGLAHMGVVMAEMPSYGKVMIRFSQTLTTPSRERTVVRLRTLARSAVIYEAWEIPHYTIIEDPTSLVQRTPKGLKKDPRAIYGLCAAYGAIVGALAISSDRITTVSPVEWYPRNRGKMIKKAEAIAMLRVRFPELNKESQHVLMAAGLALHFSKTVAPLIWDRQRRGVLDHTPAQSVG